MSVNTQIDRDDKLVDIEHGFVFMKPLDPLIALAFGDKTLSSELVAHRVIRRIPFRTVGEQQGEFYNGQTLWIMNDGEEA